MQTGAVYTEFIADTKKFQTGLNESVKSIQGFSSSVGDKLRNVQSSFKSMGDIAKIALGNILADGFSSAVSATKAFVDESLSQARRYETAMTTLDIIAPRFSVDAKRAKEEAKKLGKELRIGPVSAASSLQNLLKSGLNLDQSIELMKRFTNEAITGKSPNISLADAVENLSFAYNTNNSAIGNLSGISENFADIIKRGRESLIKQGIATNDITDDMAKYEGMINLTNLTLGSAEKLEGTVTDQMAEKEQRIQELQITLGTKLLPLQTAWIELQIKLTEKFAEFLPVIIDTAQKIGNFIEENKEVLIAVGGAIAIVIVLAGAIWLVNFAMGALVTILGILTSPITLIVAGIMLLAGSIIYLWRNNEDFKNGVLAIWEAIKIYMKAYIDVIIAIISGWVRQFVLNFNLIRDVALGLISFFRNVFTGDFKGAGEDLKGILSTIKQYFKDTFDNIRTTISGIIQPIQKAIDKLKELAKEVDVAGKAKDIGGSIIEGGKKLFGFATGGVVPGNGARGDKVLARMNPGEMVLTKQDQSALFAMLKSGGGSTGANITINVNGAGDPRTVAEIVSQKLARMNNLANNGVNI